MKIFVSFIILFIPFIGLGQNQTYVGIEVGPKFEIYQHIDSGDKLNTKPFLFSPIYGITLEQEINQNFSGVLGLYVNNYGESYRIEGEFGYGASNAILAYQIPLRLKAKLNLIEEKLSITTTIGYTIAINSDYNSSGSGGSFSNSFGLGEVDSIRTEYTSNYGLKKTYGLIETGISLDYELENYSVIYLSANYLTGLSRVVEIDVDYWFNDEPQQSAQVFSNGDYFSVVFGYKYPISRVWKKKEIDP